MTGLAQVSHGGGEGGGMRGGPHGWIGLPTQISDFLFSSEHGEKSKPAAKSRPRNFKFWQRPGTQPKPNTMGIWRTYWGGRHSSSYSYCVGFGLGSGPLPKFTISRPGLCRNLQNFVGFLDREGNRIMQLYVLSYWEEPFLDTASKEALGCDNMCNQMKEAYF